jgi:cytochrome d ubiquinol oxidase subunit I
LEHQPAKLAAMEGIWKTDKGVGAVLFAVPDAEQKMNRYELSIPKLASFYLTHDINGEVKGLDAFGDDHPPVGPVFWAFRIMVGVGLLMLAVSWWSTLKLRRDSEPPTYLATSLSLMTFAGWLAVVPGWYVTEIGRQPWLVYGVLRTADAASSVPPSNIAASLTIYLLLYAVLLAAYVSTVFYLAKKAASGAPGDEPRTGVQSAMDSSDQTGKFSHA